MELLPGAGSARIESAEPALASKAKLMIAPIAVPYDECTYAVGECGSNTMTHLCDGLMPGEYGATRAMQAQGMSATSVRSL